MNARRRLPRIALAGLLACASLATPRPSHAHPMGNFSISHYTGIKVAATEIEIRYLLDLAEIPTFQEIQDSGIAPQSGHPELEPYLARKAAALGEQLRVDVDGQRLALASASRDVLFSEGAGGLPTMKLGFVYRARLGTAAREGWHRVEYRDGNFADRAGWKEVVAAPAPGIALASSSVPERDRSRQLSDYPTDPVNSPPQVLEAQLVFGADAPVTTAVIAAPAPPRGPERTAPPRAPEATKQHEAEWSRSGEHAATPGRASTGMMRSETAPSGPSRERAPELPTTRPTAASPFVSSVHDAPTAPEAHRPGVTSPGTELRRDAVAAASVRPAALALQPNRQATRGDAFTNLIGTADTGLGVFLFAALVAATLGAFHALEPGHGKTVVAAYLVGSRGTARHAVLLGLIVTASHTIGVYVLGAVTLYASRYVLPERLYPWLGVLSGLTIAGLGIALFVRRYGGAGTHHHHHHGHHHHGHDHFDHGDHGHADDSRLGHGDLGHDHDGHGHADPGQPDHHDHDHGEHGQHHYHDHHARAHHRHGFDASADPHVNPETGHAHIPADRSAVSLRALFALGITGGIVPCPAALVVLLSAVALHRVGFGLFLIAAFSVGLAAVLIAIGILMVSAAKLMARFRTESPLITRWLPLTSSAVIGILGMAIAVQALLSAGIVQIRLG